MRSQVAESSSVTAAPQSSSAAILSIGLVVIAGVWASLTFQLGPYAAHMLAHIAILNVVAPLLALALGRHMEGAAPSGLWAVTALQLAMLAGWHALPVHGSHAIELLLQGALLAVATAFWLGIFGRRSRWHAPAALLVTGKLVCLAGVLLVFSPTAPSANALADQQLAGLLMITACPLSYVACALVLAVRDIESVRSSPT